MRHTIILAAAIFTIATTNLQAQNQKKGEETGKSAMKLMTAGGPTKAVVVLHATKSGGEAGGKVTFTKVEGGIKVQGEISGLTPGEHGFHIHEFGDVSSPDAMSAGGHFNPSKSEHGAPTAEKRHAGDLGNITASAKGVAKIDFIEPHMSFLGSSSIIGHSVIVHDKADDLKTQPTGNAGARVAAGVIGVAKPE